MSSVVNITQRNLQPHKSMISLLQQMLLDYENSTFSTYQIIITYFNCWIAEFTIRFDKLNAIATLILDWVINRTTHAARNYHENHASK